MSALPQGMPVHRDQPSWLRAGERRAPTGNPRRSEALGAQRARSAPPGCGDRCCPRLLSPLGPAPDRRRAPQPARTHLPVAGTPDGGRPVVDVALHHRAAHVHPQHVPRRGGPAVGLPARHRPEWSAE